MTMGYGSRLVFSTRFQQAIFHGAPWYSAPLPHYSHRARDADNFLSFGPAHAPQELLDYFPLHAVPVGADQVPTRANGRRPTEPKGVHQ